MSPFIHGALFAGGIGLVSIPIIIHIINRRRFRQLEWAAMEFLLEAMRRNRRRIRLEHLILLLLRTLLILLIVGAVARPHLSQESFGWMSGPFKSEEKVFLIDDSLSSAHVEAGRSSLGRAVDAVLQAAERVALDGGRDPLTVVRASRFEVPLFNAVLMDTGRLESLRRQLEGGSFKSTAVRLDLAAAFEDLASSTRPERGRVVSVVTDLCRSDWTDGQGQPLEALRGAIERLAGNDPDSPTRILVLDIGPGTRDNLAITDFAMDAANPIAGISVDLTVEVANHGATSVGGVGVRLRTVDSVVPGPRIDELAGGETVELKIPHVFLRPGSTWIEAELDGVRDGLDEDDRRGLAVEVLEAVQVLVVDGEPSGVFGAGESDFLVQALRPAGDFLSGFAPAVVVEGNLPGEGLEEFGVVALANLTAPPEEFARALGEYVRGGGGLVIFPGDQVDGNAYERLLGVGTPESPGADLLPASIGEAAGDVDRPVHVKPTYDHPAFQMLSDGGDELFRLVDVAFFRKLTPLPSARVVATLTDPEVSPLLVDRAVGEGSVALFAVPADAEWTNWPRNPSFLPVILELTTALARPQGAGWNRTAGSPIDVPIDLARHQREATLRDPEYPNTPERRLLATQVTRDANAETDAETDAEKNNEPGEADPADGAGGAVGAGLRFRVDDTRQGGVYSLLLKTVSGDDEVRHLAVNAAAAESDLRKIPAPELEKLYEGLPITVVRDPTAFAESGGGHFEIADALLALFLLVLLVEGTLAWWFAHHRSHGAGDLTERTRRAAGGAVRDATVVAGEGR